jgi:hypothetical protein
MLKIGFFLYISKKKKADTCEKVRRPSLTTHFVIMSIDYVLCFLLKKFLFCFILVPSLVFLH